MTRTPTQTPTPTPTIFILGDANCNDVLERDADLDAMIARLFSPGCVQADVTEDDEVRIDDLLRLLGLLVNAGN